MWPSQWKVISYFCSLWEALFISRPVENTAKPDDNTRYSVKWNGVNVCVSLRLIYNEWNLDNVLEYVSKQKSEHVKHIRYSSSSLSWSLFSCTFIRFGGTPSPWRCHHGIVFSPLVVNKRHCVPWCIYSFWTCFLSHGICSQKKPRCQENQTETAGVFLIRIRFQITWIVLVAVSCK